MFYPLIVLLYIQNCNKKMILSLKTTIHCFSNLSEQQKIPAGVPKLLHATAAHCCIYKSAKISTFLCLNFTNST